MKTIARTALTIKRLGDPFHCVGPVIDHLAYHPPCSSFLSSDLSHVSFKVFSMIQFPNKTERMFAHSFVSFSLLLVWLLCPCAGFCGVGTKLSWKPGIITNCTAASLAGGGWPYAT